MAVITISRGSFSGGKMLAECLADALGYRCIDRDVIVDKAAAYGATQEELRATLDKPPSFLDRMKHKRYIYLTLIQAALLEEVRGGKAIYHGNAGHLLLRGVSHVLRVRIIAPLEYRVAMVQDSLKLGPAEALAYVQKMDQDRARWTQYLYGVGCGDPTQYDLVLSLERMDIREACEVIAHAAQMRCFEETPEYHAALEDLALASRVRASLIGDPRTSQAEVDIRARSGAVTLNAAACTAGQMEDVQAIVWRVPGVKEIAIQSDTAGAEA